MSAGLHRRGTREALSADISALLDANGATRIVLDLDATAARQLVKDLRLADYACGSCTHFTGAYVIGQGAPS